MMERRLPSGKKTPVYLDPDVFAQVLNLFSNDNVILPSIIPRETFYEELDYFGLAGDEGIVTTHARM
jgi:hypothetical protein